MRGFRFSWRIAGLAPLIVVGVSSIIATGGNGGRFAPNPPATDQRPAGIWQGTLTSDVTARSTTLTALVSAAGDMRIILADGSELIGLVVVDGGDLSGELAGIAALGRRWDDNTTVASFTIHGTLAERQNVTATYDGAGDRGQIMLQFDSVYDRSSSPADAAGNWLSFDALQNPAASFSLAIDGQISGSDVDGCIYGGSLSTADPTVNLYSITLSVAGCDVGGVNFNGSYTGGGFLSDATTGSQENDALVIAVSSSRLVISFHLNRG